MNIYQSPTKSKLGTFPIGNVIFSTMLALFVMGLFGLLLVHVKKLTEKVQENISIQVYLNKKVTKNDRLRLEQTFSTEPFILRKDGVPQIVFISKKEAAEIFILETGENFMEVLQENPLRDSFILYIAPSYQSSEALKRIKEQINTMTGIFEVCYVQGLAATIHTHVGQISVTLIFFSFILLLATTVLINNTIKLALYSQRFLIRTMNLVGATASFIRRPFLLRSILIGLLAGTIADVFLLTLLHYANLQLAVLAGLQEPIKIFILLATLPLLGSMITMVGSYRAINKYLHLSLEDLH